MLCTRTCRTVLYHRLDAPITVMTCQAVQRVQYPPGNRENTVTGANPACSDHHLKSDDGRLVKVSFELVRNMHESM